MVARKGEDAGALSFMRKLVLFVIIVMIMVGLYLLLKDKSLSMLNPLFSTDIFSSS